MPFPLQLLIKFSMELILKRCYFEKGTNGALFINNQFICFTIELPWLNNKKNMSCIPEGCYQVEPRYSVKFRNHLQIMNVPDRSLILIHTANVALRDLEGCIAPVSQLSGIGTGWSSRLSLDKLLLICHQVFERKENLSLIIKS